MKKLVLIPLLILTSMVLVGCSEKITSPTHTTQSLETQKRTVKIGVIAPLAGPAATYGGDSINAYKDALKNYENDQVEVEVIYENGGCNAKDGTSAAQKLMNVDKVDFILGGLCSGETIAPAKIAQSNGTLLLSPTASSPEITPIGDKIFRLWNDADAGREVGKYLNKNHKRIALIIEGTDYAKGLASTLKKSYDGFITTTIQFDTNEKDYSILAKQLAEQKDQFDGIIVVNQTESTVIGLMKGLDSVGLVDEYRGSIIGFYLFTSQTVLEQIPEIIEGNIEAQIAGGETMGEKALTFTEYFQETYGIESLPLMVNLEREGMQLLLDGISEGNYDTQSMQKYFQSLTKENPRDGYIGEYYFDENGDAIGLEYVMQKIVDGKGVVIE